MFVEGPIMLKDFLNEADIQKVINSPQNSQYVKELLGLFTREVNDKKLTERFINWHATQLRKAENTNQDCSMLNRNVIDAVKNVGKMLPQKYIQKINPFALKSYEDLDAMIEELDPSFLRAEAVVDDDDLEKIFENDEALVINVKTYNGSYRLSQGKDKWCTSYMQSYFNQYIKNGPIFRIYIKNPGIGEKYKKCSIA